MTDALKSVGAAPDFMVKREWPVVRLWRIAKIRSEKNRPELPLLSVFLGRGVIAYEEGGGQVHKPGQDLSIYQVVHKGDFVLNNQQAWRGSVGVSKYHGITSPAYLVLALSNSLGPRFADYLFQSRVMVAQNVTASKGVGDIQRDIHIPWLKNIKVPLPPHDEQDDIVRFLDHANGRIERAVRAKKKLIVLLNEQKQVIIHHAVTRGLTPTIPLKPSGNPCLGYIPQHWEQHSLWTLSKFRNERNPGNLPLLSVFLDRGVIRYEEGGGQVHAPSLDLSNYQVVHLGDFVLNNQQAWRGSVGVSPHHGIISPAYIVLSLSSQLDSEYANYLMRCSAMVDQFVAASKGVGDIQRQVFWPFLRVVQVPLAPLEEQREIANHLRSDTLSINIALKRAEREIELLHEYRTRLIADVVTGTLNVREAVANLPAPATESEALSAEDDPDDDVMELAEMEAVNE